MSGERAAVAANAVRTGPDAVLRQHWARSGLHPSAVVAPVDWDEIYADDRSMQYHVHALDPIGLPLAAHSHTPDSRWIDYALALALDWLNAYPSMETESPFAWYDMAVGLRAYRLAYLLDVSARDPSRPDDSVRHLLDGIHLHMEYLADDARFAAHSNHGLYQAAGQLAVTRRFPELRGMSSHRDQARSRLESMIATQFTDEGVHNEHSPGYHRIVLDTLLSLVRSGLIDDPNLIAHLARVEEALVWFVRPDRRLVTIGDTDAKPLPQELAQAQSQSLRFMATGGKEGAPPQGRVRAFPRSGYVVFRERWPSGPEDFAQGAHLVQACGFHSRTHKHADDLSFTWFERGRIYVESTRAHNTVGIDGTSHDRRASPYGSALDAWGHDNGISWARSSVTFSERIEHMRLLFLKPGRFLLVVDDLTDQAGNPHHFCQRFHAAPELTARPHSAGVTLSAGDEHVPPLHAVALTDVRFCGVVKGQRKPDLLGWMSREPDSFHPTATFAFEREYVSHANFATLFWWGPRCPVAVQQSQVGDRDSPERIFEWRDDEATHRLAFNISEAGLELSNAH
jgi:hypothetical protein